ncbi:formylglycine-generating enzyme family protein [Thalassoglobus sp.]|uniref:formylglycine-generating enzyme family protein n=1 Tax=Thalassoglobus sp. TaxID=2795869 RepID=UPI003AA7F51D
MKKIYLLVLGSCLLGGLLFAAILLPVSSTSAKTNADGLVIKPPSHISPEGFVWVPGGSFVMGTDYQPSPQDPNPDRIKPDESPAHTVELDGFWMSETPVTNQQFQEFVQMTGYVTFAEKVPTREDFAKSGVDPMAIPEEALKPGSMCFNDKFDRASLVTEGPGWEYQVWAIVDGADWKHPNGPDSSIEDRMDHPVVHLTWEDAVAYCDWAGMRLPTEAEFEYANRNGGKNSKYFWGEERDPDGKFMANYWQGEFPTRRENEDGYLGTSPVKSFPANELGLYDMAGNVWEWCADYYHHDYYAVSPKRNPKGPAESFDPREPGIVKRVQRGGSFLCNTNSCTGYRTGARMAGEVMSSSFHNGFRCVLDTTMIEEYQFAQDKITAWKSNPVVAKQ